MSALLVAGLLVACGDQPVEPDPPRPASVSVVPSTVSFAAAGETAQLTAQVTDQYGNAMSGVSVNWSSSNAQAATVDQIGLVTAVGDGETTVTAQAGNASGTAGVTVARVPASVSVEPNSVVFTSASDTAQVSATVFDANGHVIEGAPLAWTSGDPAVATVTPDGLVTAVGDGETTVTAQAGNASGTAMVTVERVPASVSVEPDSVVFTSASDTTRVSATVFDANGHVIEGVPLAWTSGDPAVATITPDGLVTAVGDGETTVTAQAGNASGSAMVTVERVPASVSVEPNSVLFNSASDTAQVSATVFDASGHIIEGAPLAWTSGDPAVATITPDGLITAVDDGETTVTAHAGNASGSAMVTVERVPASVSVEPNSVLFTSASETYRVSATVFDANGHVIEGVPLAWTSGDPAVATVAPDGLITAVGDGETTVTARAGNASGSTMVTVERVPASISVEPGWVIFSSASDTARVSATVFDANGHVIEGAPLAWTSGDPAVATITPQGLVTAVGSGETTVTAQAGNASGSARVSVERVPALVLIEPGSLVFASASDTARITATVLDANDHVIEGAPLIWTSGDPAVATVSPDGLVTAVGDGETTVTAQAGNASGSAMVTVERVAASVSIEPDSVVFASASDTARITATVLDANDHVIEGAPLAWTSGDPAVATITPDGLVTAVGDGETTITAQAGNASGSAMVTVERVAASVSVEPDSVVFVSARDTARIAATVFDANGHLIEGAPLAWTSGDSAVATITPNGLVTAVGDGVTTITAQAGNASGSAMVTVERVAASVSVEPDSVVFVSARDTARIAATAFDANGHVIEGAPLAWTSGDSLVATITPDGLLTAVGGGETTVGVVSGTAQAGVFVRVALVADSIVVAPAELTFAALGEGASLSATVLDANGNPIQGAGVEWATSDDLVATVDASGVVTAAGNGETSIAASIESISSAVRVTVAQVAARIVPASESLFLTAVGDSARLFAEVFDGNGHPILERSVAWTSSDPSIASVDTAGLVTANRLGRAELFARMDTVEASVEVEVLEITDDRGVLELLYRTAGGEDWRNKTNWLTRRPISEWHGVEVDGQGRVTHLWLSANNLAEPLHPVVGKLEELVLLDLSANELSGTIPSALGQLKNLEFLWLSENRFEGPLPPELGALESIVEIVIGYNQLSEPIPPEWGALTTLQDLSMQGNRLSGPLPPEIGDMAALQWLVLFDNEISGPIPPEIGNMSELRRLQLSDNQLSGPIPPELGQLQVEILELQQNRLSGSIPPELGQLPNAWQIRLFQNDLSGTIPPELGNLPSVKELALSWNRLSGPIPPELGRLTTLEWLVLSRNQLSGSIPPELGQLPNVQWMWLFENELTGSIPPGLGNAPLLEELLLSTNRLSVIPPEIAQGFPSLTWLSLEDNDFSGPIPVELALLPRLQVLGLNKNAFSGTIPPEFGYQNSLERLALQRNPDLGGLIPRSLMNLPLVELLAMETGLCPQVDDLFQEWYRRIEIKTGDPCPVGEVERLALSEFHNGTDGDSWTSNDGWNSNDPLADWYGLTVAGGRVRELRMPNNGVRGPLLPELVNLTELEFIELADNELTGEFPLAFAHLADLNTLRLSGNEGMTGPLPFEMTGMSNLQTLAFRDTDLCAPPSRLFQEWLAGIDVVEGATCDNPEEVLLSLPVVYLTQAIQRQAGDIPVLADRDALLRVFLGSDEPNAFFEPEVEATLLRSGREVHRVTMRREAHTLSLEVDESDLSNSYNAVIPARHLRPGVRLVVQADPDGVVPLKPGSQTRFPATGSHDLGVIEVPPMEVTVVPVLEDEEPDSSIFEWTDAIADDSPEVGLLKYSFPFSEFTARSRDPYVTSLDLTRDDGGPRLVQELQVVRAAENGTGYWYGAAASVRGYALLGAWVGMGKAWDTEFAHEVGHNLDLRHAPCGGALGTDPDYPHDDGSIGAWGYDFRDHTVVSPRTRRDIMGYCYELGWLSDYYYEKVIDYRERVEGARAASRLAGPPTQSLVLWGGVVNGEIRLEPTFSMTTTAHLPTAAGDYRLEGTDASGGSEFSLSFTPDEDKFGNKYFFFTLPIDEDWTGSLDRITLTGPEGTVTTGADDTPSISVVTDVATGQVRAILRDLEGALPPVLGPVDNLRVETTRGVAEAVRLRR